MRKVDSMHWNYIRYENGMGHAVSDELLAAVRDDMERQNPPGLLQEVREVREIGLELGGACMMHRPLEDFVLDDLAIWIPSEDLSLLLRQWRSAPAVISLGQVFHRFVSWPWKCLALAPSQREDLLALLDARVDTAERRAVEFYASRESPQESMRKYYEDQGLSLPCGPDKIDRLRS